MHEKMYNGIEPSYLNVRISPTMPQLCTQEQPYYNSGDLHHSPSRDVGGSDSYGSPVSSIGSPDIKSASLNLDDSFKGGGNCGSDRKSIKILQRPSTARSTEGRLHLDGEAPFTSQPVRRGHRKKTLSLDPEEREALESLIEDVIIVGLDDAAVDSDDSFDGNDEERPDGEDGFSPDRHSKSFPEARGYSDKFLGSRDAQRGKAKNNGGGGSVSLNRSYNNNGSSGNNGFSKDPAARRHGKDAFKAGQGKGSKDFARNKDPGFSAGKMTKETPKKPFVDCPQEESMDRERQSIAGILGVNIYPAQLKVAIKHMDSLPPRFLRRLQTGQNRMGGSEPALQSLSELNLNSGRDSFPRSGALDSSSGMSSEKDRSRSKHSQLEETKKTIRNLLSDLDQYTDEGVTTPMSAEGSALGLGSFMPVPRAIPPMGVDRGAAIPYEMKAPPMVSPVFRMPHTRYSSESRLDAHHPDVYNRAGGAPYYNSPVGFRPELPQSREFVSLDVASHAIQGYPGYKAIPDYPVGFTGQYEHSFAQHQPQLLKRTSLKVDAPVFISSQFQRRQPDAASQRSPTLGQGPQMTSTPSKSIENGGIAFLPGVLNADAAKHQQHHHQQQQLSISCKSPVTSYGPPATPQSFKMMHGPVFSPVQSVGHQSGVSLQNGMIHQQQQASNMMRMMNFGQVPSQVHPGGHQMHPYPPYAPQSHPSMYMRAQDFPTSVYQPWSCSPPNGDVPSGDSPWFPPMIAPYLTHPTMEGAQAPYVVSGDHQGLVPVEMLGQDWKVGLPFTPSDGIDILTLEVGRQRALQLLTEGRPVFVLLAGSGEADRASKLQLNIAGMVVVNLSDGGAQMCNLSPMKVKEQQDWNYRQVMEAMEARKNLIIVELSYAQQSEVSEFAYMAQVNGYEAVVVSSYQKYHDSPPSMEGPPLSLFVGGSPDYKVGMAPGFPSPSGMMKQAEGSLDFPSNSA